MKAQFPRANKARSKKSRNAHSGVMLLEVLVSILLFALGIVALLGFQARSLMVTSDTQYRAEAVHLASAYLGQMWASGLEDQITGLTRLQTSYQTGGALWQTFHQQVMQIPGAADVPDRNTNPNVTIVPRNYTITSTDGSTTVQRNDAQITITISWVDREASRGGNTVVHSYTQTSGLGYD